ncbi:hypothetical protein ACFX13_018539 [Malus domestica]
MEVFSEVVAGNSVGNFNAAISYRVPLSNPWLSDNSRGLYSTPSWSNPKLPRVLQAIACSTASTRRSIRGPDPKWREALR